MSPTESSAESLAALLAAEIRLCAPGTRLPSEQDLAQQYAVPRSVVRNALANLESRLLVTRIRGQGTFVPERVELTVSNQAAPSMHGLVTAAGRQLSTTLLSSAISPLPGGPAELLDVDPATPALTLTRLGTIGGRPFNYVSEWLLPSRARDLDAALSVYKSVYQALIAFGFSPIRAATTASVEDLPLEACRHLQVDHRGLGWNITTRTVDKHTGLPLMASTARLRLDAANVTVAVHQPDS